MLVACLATACNQSPRSYKAQTPSVAYQCCAEEGTCSGDKYCTACKNCRYCKHCSKDGGSCGVCK